MPVLPEMKEFRTEMTDDGVCHLIFDAPGRGMNVFTRRAIREAEAFADWLKASDVKGVVVRSGKDTAFCVGADLGELSTAYDMIMATPAAERDAVTVEEFSPIGRAFRKLETAGKPVAVAIHGLALGGGCELALACHYRVVTTAPETALGLPESLVGLLPGGGGTQRLPRVVGIEASLPILLEGGRHTSEQALALGLAQEAVAPGEEVSAAEAWVRSGPDPRQPWDRPDWRSPSAEEVAAALDPVRRKVLDETGGHCPAPLAILDCLYRGLPVSMDHGVAEEIDIFKDLVQRIEPRNMIQVQFLGRVEHDKRRRKETLPVALEPFCDAVREAMTRAAAARGETGARAVAFAGIGGAVDAGAAEEVAARRPQWFLAPEGAVEDAALAILAAGALAAEEFADGIPETDRNLADFAAARKSGFPAYLGGPFTFLSQRGAEVCRNLAG